MQALRPLRTQPSRMLLRGATMWTPGGNRKSGAGRRTSCNRFSKLALGTALLGKTTTRRRTTSWTTWCGWSHGKFRSWLLGTGRLSSPRYVNSMPDRELWAPRAYLCRTVSPRKYIFWTLLRGGVSFALWRSVQRSQCTCRVLCLLKPRARTFVERDPPPRGRSASVARFGGPLLERLDRHFVARAARR